VVKRLLLGFPLGKVDTVRALHRVGGHLKQTTLLCAALSSGCAILTGLGDDTPRPSAQDAKGGDSGVDGASFDAADGEDTDGEDTPAADTASADVADADASDTSADIDVADTRAAETSDADPALPPVSANLFLYRASTGEARFARLSAGGDVRILSSATLPSGITQLVGVAPERLFGYDAVTGKRTSFRVDVRTWALSPLAEDTAKGWTAFAPFGANRLLSYRTTDGALRVDALETTTIAKVREFVPSSEAEQSMYRGYDLLTGTRTRLMLLYATGSRMGLFFSYGDTDAAPVTGYHGSGFGADWRFIVPLFSSGLVYVDGAGHTADPTLVTTASGALKSEETGGSYTFPGMERWTNVAATFRTLLFYRQSDAHLTTAVIESEFMESGWPPRITDVTPVPPPAIGTGWTHIVSLE
jgi:hypothetical protein